MKRSTKKIIRNILIAVMILGAVIALVMLFVDFPSDTEKTISIETPYCNLEYPAKWKDELRFEHNDGYVYEVEFYANIDKQPEQHIFDIWFGAEGDEAYEYITTVDGEIIGIGTEIYEFALDDSWSEKQIEELIEMQDSIHILLSKLPIAEAQNNGLDDIRDMAEDEITYDDMVIDTPYGQLSYPGNYGEQIEVKHLEGDVYTVEFYGKIPDREKIYLFSVCFGGDQGENVGTITDASGKEVAVNIILEEFIPGEGWSEKESDTIYAMQEGVNEVISSLIK